MDVKFGLLTLRDERTLRVFENRELRRIFGPKREAVENCTMNSFITCTLHGIILGQSSQVG
jgi:hypothetical protein